MVTEWLNEFDKSVSAVWCTRLPPLEDGHIRSAWAMAEAKTKGTRPKEGNEMEFN